MRKVGVIICTLLALAAAIILLVATAFRDRRPAVYFAVMRGDTNALDRYFRSGGDVNTVVACYRFGRRSTSLLNLAVGMTQLESARFLLSKGADPNFEDQQGESPLTIAVSGNGFEGGKEASVRIVGMLLNAGADANRHTATDYGTYPLLKAAMLGQTEVASLLLAAGANVNATNGIGQSALDIAQNEELVKILVAAGAVRKRTEVTNGR